jgi:hypothetical protein
VEGKWPHGLAGRPPLDSPIKGLPRLKVLSLFNLA